MSTVKKQHYVPQFYLRKFADSEGKLHVFDKPQKKAFASNTRDIANEPYFFNADDDLVNAMIKVVEEQTDEIIADIKQSVLETHNQVLIKEIFRKVNDPQFKEKMLDEVKDKQFYETKVLAPFDEYSAKLLNKVLEEVDRKEHIKRKHRHNLAFITAVQYLRTRRHREQITELGEKSLNAMIAKGFFGEEYKNYEIYYKKEQKSREHVNLLSNYELKEAITGVLENHIWRIGINNTDQPFYTSDAPIVLRGHIPDPYRGLGFGSRGIEIAFPLTPKHILLFWERTTFKQYEKLDGKILNLTEQNVTYYNSLQVGQSYRQVYCSGTKFDLALKMCDENPELCNPNKPTIIVE